MKDKRDRPETGMVITPQMIEAGVKMLADYLGDEGDDRLMAELISSILSISCRAASATEGTYDESSV
jgi:hypothetical protein